MKSLVIAGTVLFVAFSAFGIATFIETKKNHSLDDLYQKNEIKQEQIETKTSKETIKKDLVEGNYKSKKVKLKPFNEKVVQAKKPKPEIEFEKFSRAAIENIEPVVVEKIEEKNN